MHHLGFSAASSFETKPKTETKKSILAMIADFFEATDGAAFTDL